MSESNAKLRQAQIQAAHWATVAKLLTFKLAEANLPTTITKEDQDAYRKAWPAGELHYVSEPNGGPITLTLMSRAEALQIDEQNRRAANRKVN